MKCLRPTGLVIVLVTLPIAVHLASLETTSRSPPEQGVTQKRLTKKLLNVNTTSADVLDVRTPPKFKVQQKPKTKPSDEIENSHAGVAIPVDADTLELEATTKKLNFYKYERPTTNSGLSTWILLSGQSSTLKPTTKKPVIKPILEGKDNAQPKENSTLVLDTKPNRIVKPIFKKKLSSTTTSTSTTTTTTSTTTTTTSTTHRPVASTSPKSIKESTKLTKIKASDLNNALNKKNITTSTTTRPVKPSSVTTTKPTTVGTPTTTSPSNVTSIETKTQNNTVSSSSLPVEAKNQEIELEGSAESKKKPANPKRKKNKNRRKKPEKVDTNVAKPIKNKNNNPISSQIYSYLAKEIMPTVGAGIVGLMVTAGLATYFLYPFGAARRSDTDIDRRDKDGSYYYSDDYSSGMPEEEAIGKVIAGMPVNTLLSNNYKSPSNRKNYPVNTGKYRIADRRANVQPQKYEGFVKGSVENVPLGPDDYQPYKNKVDRKFVVGNVPKEVNEVTPVTVPEHGPRNLKLQKISNSDTDLAPAYGPRNLRRRKRDLSEDFTEDPGQLDPKRRLQRSGISNELDSDDLPPDVDKTSEDTKEDKDVTTITPNTTLTEVSQETTTVSSTESVQNFFDNIKYVLFLKARLALEVLRNATSLFSSYISNVQSKVENKYRNFIRRYESIS